MHASVFDVLVITGESDIFDKSSHERWRNVERVGAFHFRRLCECCFSIARCNQVNILLKTVGTSLRRRVTFSSPIDFLRWWLDPEKTRISSLFKGVQIATSWPHNPWSILPRGTGTNSESSNSVLVQWTARTYPCPRVITLAKLIPNWGL